MAPRAYWKGSLKLSLVSCPVALYPASTSAEKTRFHMINRETGNRLKQQMVDAETGDVVESDQKGRGYELKKGQYVEIEKEELEAVVGSLAQWLIGSGVAPKRIGNAHPNIVPYQPFEASDQRIIIAVGNDRQFARLAEMCGHPEWVRDERFASNATRVANREAMVSVVADCIRRRPAAE